MVEPKKPKLAELYEMGCMPTGRYYTFMAGPNKGKRYPVYAIKDDVAALVYNDEQDKVELVYKLHAPFTGKAVEQDKSAH